MIRGVVCKLKPSTKNLLGQGASRYGEVIGLQQVQAVNRSFQQFVRENEDLASSPWKKRLKVKLILQGGNRSLSK